MGVFDRLAKAVRDRQMAKVGDKPLSELTDAELARELQRRRNARGYRAGSNERQSAPRTSSGRIPGWKAREWLRALELGPRASFEEVEAAYQRLTQRYDPGKYEHDQAKHRDATRVVTRLREAYSGLQRYFDA